MGTMYQHFTNKIILSAAIGIFSLTAVIASTAYAVTDQEFAADCHKKIDDLEQQAAGSGNPEFYKQAADAGFSCLKEGVADSRDSMLFPLGADELHETSNYLRYCKGTIAQKEKTTASAPDPMVQFSFLKDLLGFTVKCHEFFLSELTDPSLAPRMGSDDLHMTSNLVNNCQAIMDKLKNQYDPFHCETSDVIKRNAVVANMLEVASYCAKNMTSDLFDPSLLPDIDWLNPYGVGAFCSHRVCGLLPPICEPETSQTSAPDSEPVKVPASETDSSQQVPTEAIPVTTIPGTSPMAPVAKVGTSCRQERDNCLQSARNVQEACDKDAYENRWSCKDACTIGSEEESECKNACYQTYHKTEIDCMIAYENSDSACMREYYRCRKTCGSIDFLDLSECPDQKPAEPPKCVSITFEKARTEEEIQRAREEEGNCNLACSGKYTSGPNNCKSECLFAQSIEELICNDKAEQCNRVCSETFYKCYDEYSCDTDEEGLDACTKRCEFEQTACNQPLEPAFERCQKNCTEADSQCMEGCRTPCHTAEGDAVQRPTAEKEVSRKEGLPPAEPQADRGLLENKLEIKSVTYVSALVDVRPIENMLKDIVYLNNPGMTFQVKIVSPQENIPPVSSQMNMGNLTATQPKIAFNSKDDEASFIIDVGTLSVGAQAKLSSDYIRDTLNTLICFCYQPFGSQTLNLLKNFEKIRIHYFM